MKKLYIFLWVLISLPLIGIAQQRDDLMNHPIVGIWDLDGFEVSVGSENKVFENQMNQSFSEEGAEFMNEINGSYIVFTEQGIQVVIKHRTRLTEFVVKEVFLKRYSILDSLITLEQKEGGRKEFFEYKISDDWLYLIIGKEEAREMLETSPEFRSIENSESIDYTFDARVRFKKSAQQLTNLNEHPITIGTWLCKEVVYDVDVDTDREEEHAKVITFFEESFQDKIAFWNNVFHFGTDGILYDLTESQDKDFQNQMCYFIADDRTITAVSSNKNVYSVDFQIEDDILELRISHLEGDFEIYASLEKEKLPPVKKAAIKIIYRSVK